MKARSSRGPPRDSAIRVGLPRRSSALHAGAGVVCESHRPLVAIGGCAVKGDREYLEQHRVTCRIEGCTTSACYFAKDNRAACGHLCWKHPPQEVGELPEWYEAITY